MRLVFKIMPWLDEAKREAVLRDDFVQIFGTERGRRVLAHILNLGQIANSTGHLTDAARRRVDVNDGRRQLALEIYDMAGGTRDRLTSAMIDNNLKEALYERNGTQHPAHHPAHDDPTDDDYGADDDPELINAADDDPTAVIATSD